VPPSQLYSAECVEGLFSELRPNGVLRSSLGRRGLDLAFE
jgi:hypothetical protein